jgi:hypothetical protein
LIRGVLAASLAALTLAGATAAKGPAEQPAWLEGSEQAAVASLFGGGHLVLVGFFPFPRKVTVVLEFQSPVTCLTCSAPSNATLPHGRVVRLSFDRGTHELTGGIRFCEIRGTTPPASACSPR